MSKIIKELEIKFSFLDSKIENKTKFINKLYTDQQGLLNERFNVERLSKKYSGEFKSCRERLMQHNQSLEINQLKKFDINRENTNAQTSTHESERTRSSNENRRVIRSAQFAIQRLIMREFRFGCKFSASQLIKYKDILGISKYLVQEGNIWDMDRALRKAAEDSNLEVIRLFIEAGANVNTKGRFFDQIALISASEKGHLEIVKYLVANGADVNAKDQHKWTALIEASSSGHYEVVKHLVENGARLDSADFENRTALLFGSHFGHFEIVKYLVEHGADVKNKSFPPIAYAAQKNHLEIVKYLVEHGADLNEKDNKNNTALILACEWGHLERSSI